VAFRLTCAVSHIGRVSGPVLCDSRHPFMLMAVCFESIVEGTEQPSVLDRSFLEYHVRYNVAGCAEPLHTIRNHFPW
jgi:hypothetical protein